jgi:hypothetical protein
MMPNNQALQVFYGSIPFMLLLAAVWLNNSTLQKSILDRLSAIEARLIAVEGRVAKVETRLAVLESRSGIVVSS